MKGDRKKDVNKEGKKKKRKTKRLKDISLLSMNCFHPEIFNFLGCSYDGCCYL